MRTALMLLAQVYGPADPNELHEAIARPAASCPADDEDGEIVVCARPIESQRLTRLRDDVVAAPPDPLSFRVPGGGTGRFHAIQSNVGGFTGPGVAITVRIPLGRKKKDTKVD
jgi:hypothetical protein